MVCFTILFAQPEIQQERKKISQESRIEHLCKHYNASSTGKFSIDGIEYLEIAVCDYEAIDLLRDIPDPMTCVSVKFHKKDIFLYKHYKVLKDECIPPRNPYLKRVYWAASQLQSRTGSW